MPFRTATPNRLMNPTDAGTLRYSPVSPERDDPPDHREGQVENDQGGIANGIKGGEQQHEDEPDRDRHDDLQAGHRALHVLEGAAPDEMIAGRKLDLFRDFVLRFCDDAFDVATQRVEADVDAALQSLAADQRRALAQFDLGEVAQGNQGAGSPSSSRILLMVSTLSRYFSGYRKMRSKRRCPS